MTEPAPRSQHPTDILIRELIATRRAATPEEVAAIVERMATAEFNPGVLRVPLAERGQVFRGMALGARAPSLLFHLYKRIDDGQWHPDTAPDMYLADLRRAIRTPSAHLAVYRRRGGNVAAAVVPTSAVLAPAQRAPEWLPLLAVFYSADRGILTSGYQCSTLDQLAMSEAPQWLT